MKNFLKAYLFLMLAVISWAVCFGYGPLRPFALSKDAVTQFIISLSITVAYGIAWFVATRKARHLEALFAICAASSAAGMLMSLMAILSTEHWHKVDFGEGFMLWIVTTPVFAAFVAAFGACLKNLVMSLFRFDFITMLFSTMLGITSGYLALGMIAMTAQMGIALMIGMLFGLVGGVSVKNSDTINSDDYIVHDANGNLHFISSFRSGRTAIDTDGNTIRRRADNNWE